ncbi:hypothetical protein ACQ4PT_056949 [Festuca glaucescens]
MYWQFLGLNTDAGWTRDHSVLLAKPIEHSSKVVVSSSSRSSSTLACRDTPPESPIGMDLPAVCRYSTQNAPAEGDWRAQLQPEARGRIVNKIMVTLKKYLPVPVPEELSELQKIAVRFEDMIYKKAADQSDYLWKITLKWFLLRQRHDRRLEMLK